MSTRTGLWDGPISVESLLTAEDYAVMAIDDTDDTELATIAWPGTNGRRSTGKRVKQT